MVATIGTSGAAIIKAGGKVSGSYITYDESMEEAEAYLCNLVKHDVVTDYGSLNATYKKLLDEYVERHAAVEAITFDMGSYTTRVEAEDMINVHIYRMEQIKEILSKADVQDFMEI